MVERQCTKCKQWKGENIDNFYMKNKTKPELGFMTACKVCMRTSSRIYGNENKERKNKIDREYREAHKAERKVKEKIWRERNKNNLYKNMKRFQKDNPEKTKQYNYEHNNHEISQEEWGSCKKYFDDCCAYCGLPIGEHWVRFRGEYILGDLHKEHVVHKGSDKLDNCIPSCKSCNSSKWKHKFEDWYNENNEIFDLDRYNKILQWLNGDYKQYCE